jgi:hypothetical protein
MEVVGCSLSPSSAEGSYDPIPLVQVRLAWSGVPGGQIGQRSFPEWERAEQGWWGGLMGRRASRFRSLVGGGAWKPPIRVGPSSGTSPTRTRRLFDNSHCVLFFFIEAISHATFSRCPFNTQHTRTHYAPSSPIVPPSFSSRSLFPLP